CVPGSVAVVYRDHHAAGSIRHHPAELVYRVQVPHHPSPAVEIDEDRQGTLVHRCVEADGDRAEGAWNREVLGSSHRVARARRPGHTNCLGPGLFDRELLHGPDTHGGPLVQKRFRRCVEVHETARPYRVTRSATPYPWGYEAEATPVIWSEFETAAPEVARLGAE